MPINVGGNIISSTSLGSNSFGKTIITDGLICHLDAGNINSYATSKIITSVKIYSTYGGGLRSANYTVQYSDNNSTWTTAFTGVMSNNTSFGYQIGSGKGSVSVGAHRYWRYVEGSSIASHHPRCSRIILSDNNGKEYTIAKYSIDNISDAGQYIIGTVTTDFVSNWYDLGMYGNNASILNSPSLTTVGGRTAFNLTSDGHYMQCLTMYEFPTTTLTMEAWLYPAASEITSGDRGTVIIARDGNAAYMSITKDTMKQSNYWYNHTPEGYHESTPAVSRGAWHHFCCVWDNSNVHQWTDGNYGKVFGVTGTSTSNPTLVIGRESSGRQFSGGIAVIKIYNRALAGAEVLSNFNALRSRFGI